METFKTLVVLNDYDAGHVQQVDTIAYEGQWWLIGTWIETNSGNKKVPCNMLLMSSLPHQEVKGQSYRFVLNNPISLKALRGESTEGFTTIVHPDAMNLDGPKTVN